MKLFVFLFVIVFSVNSNAGGAAYFELLRLIPKVQSMKDSKTGEKSSITKRYIEESMDDARAAGIDTIVIPYPEYFGYWFYRRSSYPIDLDFNVRGEFWSDKDSRVAHDFDPIKVIMRRAEFNDQSVLIGTGRNGDTHLMSDLYSYNYGAADTMRYGLTMNERYSRSVEQTKLVAKEMYNEYKDFSSFSGFYISHEINSLATSVGWLSSVTTYGDDKLLDYGKEIMISPAHTYDLSNPSTVNNIIVSGVSIIAPQDAVGAGYDFSSNTLTFNSGVTIPQLPDYYQKWLTTVNSTNSWFIRNGYPERTIELWTTTELWSMDGPSYNKDYPADAPRIKDQIANSAYLTHKLSFYAWLGIADDGRNTLFPSVRKGDPTEVYNAIRAHYN